MTWCEISAVVPVELAELAAEAMCAVAPDGVAIEDPLIPLGPDEGVRLERRRPSVVKAYLPVDDRLGERLDALDAALAALGLHPELRTRTVHEQDWADAWKAHFHVERIGRRLVIRPSWQPFTPAPDDVVIDLDPGMAFGTGQHPTTRTCLELLEEHVVPGSVVLDVGTGSGILAVAAVKLGAARCLALDGDPQAVRVARENAVRNGVADRVQVAEGTLPIALAARHAFDLALANITAAAVAALAPALATALRPGGMLIGSGIVADRLDQVLAAMRAAGFTMRAVCATDDWRTVVASTAPRSEPG
jgi:ribosomal protein L11 methyltransferase